ncbi:MAG: hypothetical protein ACP6IQ_10290 [Candidatus Njordarchaeia archaeon]|nr:hypothetical protein [Candidatus Korarchaeota archaeon]
MEKTRAYIFMGGKGGSGRTPISLILSSLLYKKGRNVVLLDMNFSNPDAFYIMTKVTTPEDFYEGTYSYKEGMFIPAEKGVRWPLQIYTVLEDEGHFIKSSARINRFLYAPIEPIDIFRSLKAIVDKIGRNIDIVVDTNLNLPSLGSLREDQYIEIKKHLEVFDELHIVYIWNVGTFARIIKTKGAEISEFDLLENTINEFKMRGVNLFGSRGEKIIHVLTPNFYEVPERGILEKILKSLKSLFVSSYEVKAELIPQEGYAKEFFDIVLNSLKEMHVKKSGSLDMNTLKQIVKRYREEASKLSKAHINFGAEAEPLDIVYHMFKIFLGEIRSAWRKNYPWATIPENLIVIPYMVKKMMNFVETLLSSDYVTLNTILKRAEEVAQVISIWLQE